MTARVTEAMVAAGGDVLLRHVNALEQVIYVAFREALTASLSTPGSGAAGESEREERLVVLAELLLRLDASGDLPAEGLAGLQRLTRSALGREGQGDGEAGEQ